MSMLCVAGKKAVHKSAVIRKKTVNRLKIALALIVTRGAITTPRGNGNLGLSFKEEVTEEREWVLQGTLDIYIFCGAGN
jgi:hypothetical protein